MEKIIKICQIIIFLRIYRLLRYTINMKNKAIVGHNVLLINSYAVNESSYLCFVIENQIN